MNSLESELLNDLFWQQDGCGTHSTALVRTLLDYRFAERGLGRFGPIYYPVITPLNILLWDASEQRVYLN